MTYSTTLFDDEDSSTSVRASHTTVYGTNLDLRIPWQVDKSPILALNIVRALHTRQNKRNAMHFIH